jgi:hypothetical protein
MQYNSKSKRYVCSLCGYEHHCRMRESVHMWEAHQIGCASFHYCFEPGCEFQTNNNLKLQQHFAFEHDRAYIPCLYEFTRCDVSECKFKCERKKVTGKPFGGELWRHKKREGHCYVFVPSPRIRRPSLPPSVVEVKLSVVSDPADESNIKVLLQIVHLSHHREVDIVSAPTEDVESRTHKRKINEREDCVKNFFIAAGIRYLKQYKMKLFRKLLDSDCKAYANVDFVVMRQDRVYFLVEVDQLQHKYGHYVCDERRMMDMSTMLFVRHKNCTHHVWVRFNPDSFCIDHMKRNVSVAERLRQLGKFIKEYQPTMNFEVAYMFYDTIEGKLNVNKNDYFSQHCFVASVCTDLIEDKIVGKHVVEKKVRKVRTKRIVQEIDEESIIYCD